MIITYNDTKKDLPVDQLYHMFFLAGWAGTERTSDSDKIKYLISLLLTRL